MFFREPFSGEYSGVYQWQGHNLSECGPSCLAMITNSVHPETRVSPSTCRALCPTPSWWYAANFIQPAQALDVALEVKDYSVSRNAGIYLSSYWGFGHWVVAWLDSSSLVYVLDPKRGYKQYTQDYFRRMLKSNIYLMSGTII